MKKVLVLCMIVAMAFLAGCCTKTVDGVTTKSFSNCMGAFLNSAPVDFVCQPNASQQATATAMLAALDAAQAAGAIFVPALAIAQASAVLKVIQGGGCFIVAELKAAFAIVDAGNLALAEKQSKMLKGSAPLKVPEYAPLRVYVK